MKLLIETNHWALPAPPYCLEGRLPAATRAREIASAAEARKTWKPSDQAYALLNQLRAFEGKHVVIQPWDSIMFVLEEEGPNPIRAFCANVFTSTDENGLVRAYLALKYPQSISTPDGYDMTLSTDGDYSIFPVAELYHITATAPDANQQSQQ